MLATVTLAISGLCGLAALALSAAADTSTAVNNCQMGDGDPPSADVCGLHLTFDASNLTWALLVGLLTWLAAVAYLARWVVPRPQSGSVSPSERRIVVCALAFAVAVISICVGIVASG
jgi:hypothetical protein